MRKHNSKHKDSTKRRERSQQARVTAIWAEFDEEVLYLGPRLFDDTFYDNRIELKLSQRKGKRGHAHHQSSQGKINRD